MRYFLFLILLLLSFSCASNEKNNVVNNNIFHLINSIENSLSTWPASSCDNVLPLVTVYPETSSLRIRGLSGDLMLNDYWALERKFPIKQVIIESGLIPSLLLDTLANISNIQILNIHNTEIIFMKKSVLDFRRCTSLKQIIFTGKKVTIYLPEKTTKVSLLSRSMREVDLIYSKEHKDLDMFFIHDSLKVIQKGKSYSYSIYTPQGIDKQWKTWFKWLIICYILLSASPIQPQYLTETLFFTQIKVFLVKTT